MQRIDENTYIDDTLVTCAEYQLFIDEMREQGKYYQPDHWTSYQFPEGKAREPILGVRHSDAVAFCEWLTKREVDEWRYHLPTASELMSFPLIPTNQAPMGYWISEFVSKHHPFAWITNVSNNARSLDLIHTHGRIRAYIFGREVYLALKNSIGGEVTLDRAIERAVNQACNRPLDFDFTIPDALNHPTDRVFNCEYMIEQYMVFAREHVRDIMLDILIEKNRIPDLFIDIITLKDRFTGLSPAFEGIRLVKERTK